MILQCLKSYTFINNGKMAQKVRKSDKKAQKKTVHKLSIKVYVLKQQICNLYAFMNGKIPHTS